MRGVNWSESLIKFSTVFSLLSTVVNILCDFVIVDLIVTGNFGFMSSTSVFSGFKISSFRNAQLLQKLVQPVMFYVIFCLVDHYLITFIVKKRLLGASDTNFWMCPFSNTLNFLGT